MARGLAKLRKRLTTDNENAEDLDSRLLLGDNNNSTRKNNFSPVRRVQFDETSFSQEHEDVDADNNK